MECPATIKIATTFPRLDTLSGNARSDHPVSTDWRWKRHSYLTSPAACPKGRHALLQGYSRFITALTGEPRIGFRFALRTALSDRSEQQHVKAVLSDDEPEAEAGSVNNCMLNLSSAGQDEECPDSAFGFELLADPDDFESAKSEVQLDYPFLVRYHAMQMTLDMRFDAQLMDREFADVIFKVLVNYMSSTPVYPEEETQLSVLSHLSLQQPPSVLESSSALLHAGFQRSAAQYPGRHGLDYRSENSQFTLNYRQLDSLTSCLALKLRDCIKSSPGIQVIVPAYMNTSPALYISWLAVLKAGFAFFPLSTSAHTFELQSIVQEICAPLVLTDKPMFGGRPWDAWYCDDDELIPSLDISAFVQDWMRQPSAPLHRLPAVSENDIAYIFYDHTTTGPPRGIKFSHQAASHAIASTSRSIPAYMSKQGYRWLQASSPISDASILEIFTTWSSAGTLCAVHKTMLKGGLTAAVNKVCVSVTAATDGPTSLEVEKAPSLRMLWRIKPPLSKSSLELDERKEAPTTPSLPSVVTTITMHTHSTTGPISISASAPPRPGILGSPLPSSIHLVIANSGRKAVPVPLGFVGELAVSGPGISDGYMDSTAGMVESFAVVKGVGRVCKTGVKARVVRDSNSGELRIEVLGPISARDGPGDQEAGTQIDREDGAVDVGSRSSVDGRSESESGTSMVDSFTEEDGKD